MKESKCENTCEYGEPVEPSASRKKDTVLFVSIIAILVILVAIIVAIKIKPLQEIPTLRYNGFLFFQEAGFWHFDWQESPDKVYRVSLRFNPAEAATVPLEGNDFEAFNNHLRKTGTVYVTFDPTADNFTYTALAAAELSISISRALKITPIAACTKNETDACVSRPIVTCDDKDKAVIFLDDVEDQPKIKLQDNCLILSGRGMEKLRVIDRVLYHWYNVY